MTNWYGSLARVKCVTYWYRFFMVYASAFDNQVQAPVCFVIPFYILLSPPIRHRGKPRNHTACVIYSSSRRHPEMKKKWYQVNLYVLAEARRMVRPCGTTPSTTKVGDPLIPPAETTTVKRYSAGCEKKTDKIFLLRI